jgi:hypothetical protein
MNVGSATRRYLPVGVTARRKLCFVFIRTKGENLPCVAEKEGATTTTRKGGEKEEEKEKGTSRPDTSAINPFRCETFESKGKFRWWNRPSCRRRICLYTLDIVLSQKCLKTGLTGRYADSSYTKESRCPADPVDRVSRRTRCLANNVSSRTNNFRISALIL